MENLKINIKRYKESVLKSAVEGELTKKRRKKNKNVESATNLLEKILAERKEKRKQNNSGKQYKEPQKINTEWLSELPEWRCRTSVEQITSKQEYGSSAKASKEWDVPVLRMGNIQDMKLDISDLKFFKKNHPDVKKLLLQDKDFLFNRTNSAELVGKCAIYYSEKHPNPCTFAWYLIRVQTFHNLFCIEYLLYYLSSTYWRNYINSVVCQQVWQANVNGTKLMNMIFTLPPFKEQQQIIQEVEEKLSVVEVTLSTIEANIKRAKQLKQSILHQAFNWQLVAMKDDNKWVNELLADIEKTRATFIWQKGNKKNK